MTLKQIPIIAGEDRWMPTWPSSIIGESGNLCGDGKLDDVRIWNTVRTGAQISANYRTQLTGSQPGLVANWKFDEGSGTTALDSTTPAENATMNGGATWSSTDIHP